MNHKSRKVAGQPVVKRSRQIISDRKLSTFEQAKLNARVQRLNLDTVTMEDKQPQTEEEKYQEYVATCAQSHDIMMETFALYTQYPDAFYVI